MDARSLVNRSRLMLPALRREEVEVVDLVETAEVDMEEEDTMEEAVGVAEAMVSRTKTFAVSQYLSFVTEGGRGGGDRGYGGGRGGGGYRGRGGYDNGGGYNNYNRDGGDRYNGGGRGGGRGYGNTKQLKSDEFFIIIFFRRRPWWWGLWGSWWV